MHPHPLAHGPEPIAERTATPPAPGRRAPTLRGLGRLAAIATLVAATAAAFAQGDADPSEVVVAQLGDATVTLEAFDLRFEAAVRSTLAQQGVEPDDETLATFEDQRPAFLEQVGQELVLSAHASELGVAAADTEVDELVEEVRAEHGDGFGAYLVEIGFASEPDFAVAIRRSLNAQRAVEAIGAGAQVDDAAIATWYEANPDLVQGPDGPRPLESVSDQISALLVGEYVQRQVADLIAASDVELFPERL